MWIKCVFCCGMWWWWLGCCIFNCYWWVLGSVEFIWLSIVWLFFVCGWSFFCVYYFWDWLLVLLWLVCYWLVRWLLDCCWMDWYRILWCSLWVVCWWVGFCGNCVLRVDWVLVYFLRGCLFLLGWIGRWLFGRCWWMLFWVIKWVFFFWFYWRLSFFGWCGW